MRIFSVIPLLMLLPRLCAAANPVTAGQLQTTPVLFVPAQSGNADVWSSYGLGYSVHVSPNSSVIRLSSGRVPTQVEVQFQGAKPSALAGEELQKSRFHYMVGSPEGWRRNLVPSARLRQRNAYPGIDIVYYGAGRLLEYDLVVRPQADPGVARFSIRGAEKISLAKDGSLVLDTAAGPLTWRAPVAYQRIRGKRRPVEAAYRMLADGSIGFRVGEWDRSAELIIDPVFAFSRAFGGDNTEALRSLYVDAAGYAYIAGFTYSANYPLVNAVGGFVNNIDAFLTKVDPNGDIVWSSILGGANTDSAFGVTVDASGAVYISGQTASPDFPYTATASSKTPDVDFDAFVMKIAGDGSRIVYCRTFGGAGNDTLTALRVTSDGSVWAAGQTGSTDFPVVAPLRSTPAATDGAIVRLNAAGVPVFSTYWGGSGTDSVNELALAANGELWFLASTSSTDLTSAGLRTTNSGGTDCYLGRLSATGAGLIYGSYFGGSGTETCTGLALDGTGLAVVAGSTTSADFPLVSPMQSSLGGSTDAFIAKVNSAGTGFQFSTFLGGSRADSINRIAVDATGNIFAVGTTGGRLPVTQAVRPRKAGGGDAIIRSQDGGATWSAADSGINEDSVQEIVAEPGSTTNALVRTSGGVYRTTNTGTTWTKVGTGLSGTVRDLAASVSTPGLWFAATTTGLYKSTNSGLNFTLVYSGSVTAVGVDPTNAQILAMGFFSGQVQRSTNQGGTWTTLGSTGGSVNQLSFDPRGNGVLLAATEASLARWEPAGSLTTVLTANGFGLRQALIAAGNPDVVYATTGVSVQRSSDNGKTFTALTAPPTQFSLTHALDYTGTDTLFAGSEWQGIYKSSDGAGSWIAVGQEYGDAAISTIVPMSGSVILAGIQGRTDAFAAKLASNGASLGYLTYLGSNWDDSGRAVAAGPGGVWYAGDTYETFPVNGASSGVTNRRYDAFLIKLVETNPACTYELQADLGTVTPAGGVRTINILTGSGCSWTATTNASWLQFVTSPSGTGTGNVTVLVSRNTGAARSTTVGIGNSSVGVTQAGTGCTYSVSPQSLTTGSAGGEIPFTLSTAAGCPWTFVNAYDWYQLKGAQSGSGPASLSLNVTANGGASRSGTFTIGTLVVGVAQGGSVCVVTPDRNSDSAPAAGGSGSIAVAAGCLWTTSSSAPWLKITSGGGGTSSGTLQWSADPNTSASARSATLTIGNATVTITQPAPVAGTGCTLTPSLSVIPAGPQRQAGSFTLTASAPNCAWSYPPLAPWVQFFPLTGTGSATIQYTIYPNVSTKPRSSVAYFPGTSVTINQAGNPLSEDERFVTMLYSNFFGRQPTPAEIAFQASALQGGMSRVTLLTNFYNSQEFNLAGRFVAGLYLGLLARDAEFGGWQFQRNALAQGQVTQNSLVFNFINSAEYGLRFGNPSNAEFVRLLYRYILLREGTDAEVAFQASALSSISRTQMASNFLNAQEFQQKLGPRMTAFLLYACILSRDGSAGELESVANSIAASLANAQLQISAFVNSAELQSILQ